jgi:hypothetical protein
VIYLSINLFPSQISVLERKRLNPCICVTAAAWREREQKTTATIKQSNIFKVVTIKSEKQAEAMHP